MQGTPTAWADWVVILPVLLPLIGAALELIFGARPRLSLALALLVVLAAGASTLALLLRVLSHGPLAMTMGRWLPPFGISFTADAIGAMLGLAAAVVTLTVLVYARGPSDGAAGNRSLHALVLLLLAGVEGAFLTGDAFNLYVWFELMLGASFGLMVLSGTSGAMDGAFKYGILNFLGTSLFLLGLGLLYGTLGTLNMADIAGRSGAANPALMTSIAAVFLVAFGTKAAAFPLNAWLPASYHTPPAAISSLLGGLLTKVGVYALLRVLVLLMPASLTLLHASIAVMAIATLLLAPLAALVENNLRRLIGYLLIGGVGASIAGLAVPTVDGIAGSLAYIVNAMLTVSALYLVAGLIEQVSGETDIRRISEKVAPGPMLSALLLVLLLGSAGVPPFLGFWPKLLLLIGAAEQGGPAAGGGSGDALAWTVGAAILVNAILTLLAAGRLWMQIFWLPAAPGQGSPGSAAASAPRGRGAAIALSLLIIALGLWPGPLLAIARTAATGLLDPHAYVKAVGLEGAP